VKVVKKKKKMGEKTHHNTATPSGRAQMMLLYSLSQHIPKRKDENGRE